MRWFSAFTLVCLFSASTFATTSLALAEVIAVDATDKFTIRNNLPTSREESLGAGTVNESTVLHGLVSFDVSSVALGTSFDHVEIDFVIDSRGVDFVENNTWGLFAVTEDSTTSGLYFSADATWSTRDGSTAWNTMGGDFDTQELASFTAGPRADYSVGDTISFVGNSGLTTLVADAISNDETLYFGIKRTDGMGGRAFIFVAGDVPQLRLVPEPGSLVLFSMTLAFCGLWVTCRRHATHDH